MAQSAQIGIAEANLYPAFSLTGIFGTAASNIGQNKLKRVFEGRGITFGFGPAFHGTSSIMARSPIPSGSRMRGCRPFW